MAYEFDKIIDRKGTNCLKYDFARERGHSEEELPLWVADMDFQTGAGDCGAPAKICGSRYFRIQRRKGQLFSGTGRLV